MKSYLVSATLAAGMMISFASYAQVPADAPAGTTGLCKDGSYYSGPTKKGACAKHGGVKDWYGAAEAKPAAAAVPAAAPAATPKKATTTTPPATPAPGGGPGLVWVNTSSKVYHCPGTEWYGKTKKGEYMSEAAAKAAGNHADHGKTCAPDGKG